MRYNSISEIIGPVMVGPSSSHTAGAVRIGQIARSIYGGLAAEASITFYGSFAHTFKGHGTDVALVSGLLGYSTFDPNIPMAMELAHKAGLSVHIRTSTDRTFHPNTARIKLKGIYGEIEVVGVSVGGGAVRISEIDGFRVQMDGNEPTLLILHRDTSGVIAAVAEIVAKHHLNVSHMEVSRKKKGETALMMIETDEPIWDSTLKEIKALDHLIRVIQVEL